MSESDRSRCLLVGLTATEQAALSGAPGAASIEEAELEQALAAPGGRVDVVVVGSAAASAVSLVQRAHRIAPEAGVVVLTTAASAAGVRRAISYAPAVPLDVRVLDAGASLEAEVAHLRAAVCQQRRHRELLANVAAQPTSNLTPPRAPLAVELGTLLEHAPLGVVVCETDGSIVGWNRRASTYLTLSEAPAELDLDVLLPGASALLVPEPEGERRALPRPLLLSAADAAELEVTAVASQLADGRPVVLLLLIDVTARRSAERARDRLTGHVELLSRVSDTLTRTLDTTEALDLLAAALVPDLADWVSIQLTDETGRLLLVGIRHRDASLAEQVELTRQRQLVAASVDAPSRRAARGDAPVLLLPEVDAEALERFLPDETLRRLARQLGVGSVVAVPLPGRGRLLGSMVLINQPGSRAFSDVDAQVALEVGRRAGVALDNARLYAQQHDLATELQRSLLTAPPQPQQAQIVVRYVAAAQAARVGGDWYDAFLQPDGTTVLVIGDVVGHDTRAAAGMSQLRGILRGIGFTTGADPAEILARVDVAIQGLLIETTATAVVARLEDLSDLEQSRSWLHWSNAGHPPPVLISADGSITVLESGDADLLLGVDPTTPRSTERTAIRKGDTLLLYTDGLVERRGQSLDEGVAALVDALANLAALPLDELCDSTLRRLLGDEPEDDVALIAVRLPV